MATKVAELFAEIGIKTDQKKAQQFQKSLQETMRSMTGGVSAGKSLLGTMGSLVSATSYGWLE